MNPGGKKSGGDTEFSVSDAIDEETERLLEVVEQGGKFGKRKQVSFKALVRMYSPWSHIIPLIAVPAPGSHLNVMGNAVC
jgi:hypothetical protein